MSGGLARRDDTAAFAILVRVHDEEEARALCKWHPYGLPTLFIPKRILARQAEGIVEHTLRQLEGNGVFPQIRCRFGVVPGPGQLVHL